MTIIQLFADCVEVGGEEHRRLLHQILALDCMGFALVRKPDTVLVDRPHRFVRKHLLLFVQESADLLLHQTGPCFGALKVFCHRFDELVRSAPTTFGPALLLLHGHLCLQPHHGTLGLLPNSRKSGPKKIDQLLEGSGLESYQGHISITQKTSQAKYSRPQKLVNTCEHYLTTYMAGHTKLTVNKNDQKCLCASKV